MGLIFYSVFSGVPILIQAYLGIYIQKRVPMVTSFTDFVQRVSSQLTSLLSYSSDTCTHDQKLNITLIFMSSITPVCLMLALQPAAAQSACKGSVAVQNMHM